MKQEGATVGCVCCLWLIETFVEKMSFQNFPEDLDGWCISDVWWQGVPMVWTSDRETTTCKCGTGSTGYDQLGTTRKIW